MSGATAGSHRPQTSADHLLTGCATADDTIRSRPISRMLAQSAPCVTSTTQGDYSGTGAVADDPLCLRVGEICQETNSRFMCQRFTARGQLAGDFSVYCGADPAFTCACPTLSYVNDTAARNNLLGCYDPTKSSCNTASPQWTQTPAFYGYNALILAPGSSNAGVCWDSGKWSVSNQNTN